MRLWVTQKGETVIGESVFRKESRSLFYFLLRAALILHVNTPIVLTPTTRRWAEAHGKPWSRNLKAENRNHEIFTRWYQARSPGFPVYGGPQPRLCNSSIISKVICSWPITTTNPLKLYTVPDTTTDCSINLFVSVEKCAYKHDEGYTSLLWCSYLLHLFLYPHLLQGIEFLEPLQ